MSENSPSGRMVVIYRTPKDPAAFDAHYFDVHVPLALKLPGLRRYEVSRAPIMTLAGERPYLIGTLYFDDLAAIKEAFASPIGRECAADRRVLAPNDEDLQMFLFEVSAVGGQVRGSESGVRFANLTPDSDPRT